MKKKKSIQDFYAMKEKGEQITYITSYDYPTATFAERAGIDMILVGDSLGMCVYGYEGTMPVTMDQMIWHTEAVRRGAPNTFVIGDMPFLSYQTTDAAAVENADRFYKEARVDCVKLEGGVRVRAPSRVVLVPVLLLAVALKPYRLERLRAFLGSTPYQVHQSLIAIGRGGLIGQGPGESVQKLFYLPAPHNDFIFAIVGEELGFVGGSLLLCVLGVVVVRGFVAARRATSRAQALLAAGLATTLAVQTLLNVSVCLNLLPAKGLPLPLVSAGGSDVLLTMFAAGLLLNVAKEGA